MKCLICEKELENKRSFATHLQLVHKMGSEEYTILYLYNNVRPTCPVCFGNTRYVSFGFKKYCKEHSNYAESEAGKIGGKKSKAWNKGKNKNNDERIAAQAIKVSGVGNHFYGKKHEEETKKLWVENKKVNKIDFLNRILNRKGFEVLTQYEEYFSRQHQYLKVKCKKCGKESEKTLQALERNGPCFLCSSGISVSESEICDFVVSLGVEVKSNTRSIIPPLELDIYCPDQKVAIEYNGFYWHGEGQKPKNYHQNKTELCASKEIQLIHIFPDEWRDKKEIIKSIIRNKLGLCSDRIFARKCNIKDIDVKEANEFFNNNHIAGKTRCKKSFGLYFDNELVAAISYRFPFQKKKYPNYIEIARFATKLNTRVIGAFGKLLKGSFPWLREEKIENILSYADLRFGSGKVYDSLNFSPLGKTGLDYWYTNGISRFNRFKFRARKPLTEKQVAAAQGVWKIFGCGNKKYYYKI